MFSSWVESIDQQLNENSHINSLAPMSRASGTILQRRLYSGVVMAEALAVIKTTANAILAIADALEVVSAVFHYLLLGITTY